MSNIYFRYKDGRHDIKLKKMGVNNSGKSMYIPVAGLNAYSKNWFKENKKFHTSSYQWANVIPYTEREYFIARNACNLPGSKVE